MTSTGRNGFGPKHIFVLTMAVVGLAVVVFLLGVMVGREVSVVEMVTGHGAVSVEEPFMVAERPAVVSTNRREPSVAATQGADLTYFQRLGNDSGPDLDASLLEDAAPPGVAGAVDETDAEPVPTGFTSYAGRPAGYLIQVAAPLRKRSVADRMAQGLVEKGYPAFVVEPDPGAPVQVFRVRVGAYANPEQAERVLRRLEDEESLEPWITRQEPAP